MDRIQLLQLLTMIYSEHEIVITDEREALWWRLFHHVPADMALKAAERMMLSPLYGAPKVSDFSKALAELKTEHHPLWIEAWEGWRALAKKHGYYHAAEAFRAYEVGFPLGARALGGISGAREWFNIAAGDVAIYKGQFRKAYEDLQEREQRGATIARPAHAMLDSKPRDAVPVGTILQGLIEAKDENGP